jgi:hypothetical protein
MPTIPRTNDPACLARAETAIAASRACRDFSEAGTGDQLRERGAMEEFDEE